MLARTHLRQGIVAAALLLAAGWPAVAADEPNAALREKALRFNDLTGLDPINGQVRALVEDAPGTKKLLAVALAMTKEKEQPFNYNAACVLARSAQKLKETPASDAFYRICYEHALKLQSGTKVGQVLALDSTNTKKRLTEAVARAKGSKEPPYSYDVGTVLGRAARLHQELDSGQFFYRYCIDRANQLRLEAIENRDIDALLKSSSQLGEAYGGLSDLFYENKKYEESEKVCREFLEKVDEGSVLRMAGYVSRRRIQALTKLGKNDTALKLADNLIKARPDDWLNLELKGWVQREIGQYEEAAKTYEDVLERIGKDKDLTDRQRDAFGGEMRHLLSGVYIDLAQVDKATEHLQTLLEKFPTNPTFHNDLGYVWADHNRKLDEAEKLIRKAIELDRAEKLKDDPDLKPEELKDNASYLDSLGWVLFRQKKFKEAREHLQKAVQDPEGQHLEIYDHLGDVQLALGEKAAAVAAWKKGLEFAGTTKRDQQRKVEVEKKVKANQ